MDARWLDRCWLLTRYGRLRVCICYVLANTEKHMNLVLADTEEFRRVKRKQAKTSAAPGAASSSAPLVETEEKRTLGLTIVRGAHIISLSVESPPPADPSARLGASAPGGAPAALVAGAGIARPAGRGAAIGLAVWCPCM
jgi:small nuclear ribonucleoprotein B and B'